MNNTSRHFVTVLGTGDYQECVYEAEGGKFACKTPFVQMAVLKYVMPTYEEGDKITVFVTEKAEAKNWRNTEKSEILPVKSAGQAKRKSYCRKIRLGKKIFRIQLQVSTPTHREASKTETKKHTKSGLEYLLRQEFPDVEIKQVRIPEGRNTQELDEIFECIYQELTCGERVYFDFTHGLRNLPMQALAVVNYAKVLKDITVGGLYYGAFELGEDREDGLRHVQILNMSSCSIIQDWTSAAEAFVKAGSGNQVYDLYQSRSEMIDVDKECREILVSLHDLTNCLETSRGELEIPKKEKDRSQKSIACAYKSFKENYDKLGGKELPTSEQPLKRLFEYIYEDIKPFEQKIFAEKDGKQIELKYTAMGMAVVEWAIRKNLIQQGYTALNETIESYVCELFGIAPNAKTKRDIVHDALKGNNRGKWKWQTVYPKSIREGWARKWEDENSSVSPDMAEVVKRMLVELPEKVFYLSRNVSKDRNTLNHFGVINYNEHVPYQVLQNNLKVWHGKMWEILESNYEVIR